MFIVDTLSERIVSQVYLLVNICQAGLQGPSIIDPHQPMMCSIIRIWMWTSWRVWRYKVCLQLWPVVGELFWKMEVWMWLKVQDPSSPGKPSLMWSTRGLEPAARSPPWSADYWKSTELRNSDRTILTVGSRCRLLVPNPTCCYFILLIPFLLSCCWRDGETCWLLNHSISYLIRPHLFSECWGSRCSSWKLRRSAPWCHQYWS